MAKTNRKKTIIPTVSPEIAQTSLSIYSSAFLEVKKITAELELEINEARKAREQRLNELQQTLKAQESILMHFALTNKDVFGEKRSFEMPYGRIGFRTGTPALKTAGKTNWADVCDKLKMHPILCHYLKTTVAPQKDKLLSDRDKENFDCYFTEVGIEVVQTESFFIEPKEEVEVIG
jgi:hypothetical protein